MNVFRLEWTPRASAKAHCDRHVSKMLLEATQILNTALVEKGYPEYAFYDPTHSGHTTIEWVKKSNGNFYWVLRLIHELQREKVYRMDSGEHESYTKVRKRWIQNGRFVAPIDFDEPMTEQPLASGDYESDAESPVERYRDYYRDVKQEQDWFGYDNGRSPPDWL